jgi:hypothetical protein
MPKIDRRPKLTPNERKAAFSSASIVCRATCRSPIIATNNTSMVHVLRVISTRHGRETESHITHVCE